MTDQEETAVARRKFLVAYYQQEHIIARDLHGDEQLLTTEVNEVGPYISALFSHSLTIKANRRSCSVHDIPLLSKETVDALFAQLRSHPVEDMTLDSLRMSTVTLQENDHTFDVFLQGDGRWKCHSSRCKSHNHYRCKHALWVEVAIPKEAVRFAFVDNGSLSDIMEY